MVEQYKAWTLPAAIDQIERCNFECEAGALSNNVAWAWLSKAAKNAPEYLPGTQVWHEVTAEASGIKISQWARFTVVGCTMLSDTSGITWNYALSNDPPGAYHYGAFTIPSVAGSKLRLAKPDEVTA